MYSSSVSQYSLTQSVVSLSDDSDELTIKSNELEQFVSTSPTLQLAISIIVHVEMMMMDATKTRKKKRIEISSPNWSRINWI